MTLCSPVWILKWLLTALIWRSSAVMFRNRNHTKQWERYHLICFYFEINIYILWTLSWTVDCCLRLNERTQDHSAVKWRHNSIQIVFMIIIYICKLFSHCYVLFIWNWPIFNWLIFHKVWTQINLPNVLFKNTSALGSVGFFFSSWKHFLNSSLKKRERKRSYYSNYPPPPNFNLQWGKLKVTQRWRKECPLSSVEIKEVKVSAFASQGLTFAAFSHLPVRAQLHTRKTLTHPPRCSINL